MSRRFVSMGPNFAIATSMAVSVTVSVAILGCGCDGAVPVATAPQPPAQRPAVATTDTPEPKTKRAPAPRPNTSADVELAPKPVDTVQYSEAGGLQYLERIVGVAKPNDVLPMIVAIHGLGDRPEAFSRLLDNCVEPARVILPRGTDPYEGGFSWFASRARSRDVDKLSDEVTVATDVLARGIAAIAKTRPTRGKPIVTGFSQGGMLTFALAMHHPEIVGTAIPVGGWLPPPMWPKAGPGDASFPKVVALHGTVDAAVPYEPTKLAVEALAGLGYDVTLRSFDGVPHAIPPPVARELTDALQDAVRNTPQEAEPTP